MGYLGDAWSCLRSSWTQHVLLSIACELLLASVAAVGIVWMHGRTDDNASLRLHAILLLIAAGVLYPQTNLVSFCNGRRGDSIVPALADAGLRLAIVGVGAAGIAVIVVDESVSSQRQPDLGVHAMVSVAAIVLVWLAPHEGSLRAVGLRMNVYLAEGLRHLVNVVAFLSLTTGFLDYVALAPTQTERFSNRTVVAEFTEADEKFFQVMLNASVVSFVLLTLAMFNFHRLCHHRGLITHRMFRNHFDKIVKAVKKSNLIEEEGAKEQLDKIAHLMIYKDPAKFEKVIPGSSCE